MTERRMASNTATALPYANCATETMLRCVVMGVSMPMRSAILAASSMAPPDQNATRLATGWWSPQCARRAILTHFTTNAPSPHRVSHSSRRTSTSALVAQGTGRTSTPLTTASSVWNSPDRNTESLSHQESIAIPCVTTHSQAQTHVERFRFVLFRHRIDRDRRLV